MTSRKPGRVAIALTFLTLVGAGTASAVPATGPTSPVTRYVPVIGNAHYLVYAEAERVNPIRPQSFNPHVNLFVLRKSGHPVRLGPVGLSPWYFSLSRSNLIAVQGNVNGKNNVHYWDLATGHHSNEVTSEDVLGAAPDGWLFEVQKQDGEHVMAQSYAGSLTDYGDPLEPGVDFAVTSGPNGFVAYANNFENENGQFTYTPWAHPNRHRTLLTLKRQNNFCTSVSESYASCIVGGQGHPLALLSLDGGKARIDTGSCATAFAVWNSGIGFLTGSCGTGYQPGTVGRLSRTGVLTYSTRRYSVVSATTAWGLLVASTHAQRSLVTLTAPRAKPHELRRAAINPPLQ